MRNIIRCAIGCQQERGYFRIFRVVLRRNPELEEVKDAERGYEEWYSP